MRHFYVGFVAAALSCPSRPSLVVAWTTTPRTRLFTARTTTATRRPYQFTTTRESQLLSSTQQEEQATTTTTTAKNESTAIQASMMDDDDDDDDDDEWEYLEYEDLQESDFINSEWLVGTVMDNKSNKIQETWVRCIMSEDNAGASSQPCVWGDGSKGKWSFDRASQYFSLSKEHFYGKEIWATTVEDFYYIQGTVRGWTYITAAEVLGQWQAKRLGVDPEEAGIAPWFEEEESDDESDDNDDENSSNELVQKANETKVETGTATEKNQEDSGLSAEDKTSSEEETSKA